MPSTNTPLGYLKATLGEDGLSDFRSEEVRAGTAWARQGQPLARLSLLESGRMDVHLETPNGRVLLGRKRAGDWVGEMEVVSPGPAAATVEASLDCRLRTLDRAAYERMRTANPRTAGTLLSAICCDLARRIRRTTGSDLVVRPGKAALLVPRLKALQGVRRERDAGVEWSPVRRRAGRLSPGATRSLLTRIAGLGVLTATPAQGAEYVKALKRDVQLLGPFMKVLDAKDGDVIVREGERSDGVYVVLKGEVRVTGGSPTSWFRVDRTMGAGELFGLVAFFDNGTRSATVTAKGTVRLAVVHPVVVRNAFLANADTGGGVGVFALDWFAGQLVSDARALNDRMLGAVRGGASG